MKFTLALVGAAAASTETGIKMLQKLNSMDQSIENMQNVKVALVQCAAAGDCSNEAAAMPALAMTTVEADASTDATTVKTDATADADTVKADATAEKAKVSAAVTAWKDCVAAHGEKDCAKEKLAAFNDNQVKYWEAKVADSCTTGHEDSAACKADKLGLKAAQSGDMPWIIVGSVVGLVCVAGAVFCYCKNKGSDEE